ncbi:MAG: HAD family hydrolase [Muribaculaceae bacterium]|nr:HAD family hydrolase [Muribaculaceae bacterium]
MKKLVIFDLDGTLLNTIADLAAASNHALQQCGFPTHSPASYPFFVGNGVTKLLERILPEDERNPTTLQKMRTHFGEYYDSHCTDLTEPYPGIRRLLDNLTDRGIAIAVASNKYQEAVTRLINHYFGSYTWAAVEGQKEGWPVKPDPSIVFDILSKCPTPKQQVLYVGDSGVDMETARRACVESCGVTWGFRPEKELAAGYADHIVHTPEEILSLATSDEL